MNDKVLSYWRCALLGCAKMARWKVIPKKGYFYTICDYHIEAIRTANVYPIKPLLTTQGFDPGWVAIHRENLCVGAKQLVNKRKVKYAKR